MSDELLRLSDTGRHAPDGRGHLSAATSNDEMFARIADLYLRPGMTVVDPMFGKGVFWKRVDTSLYDARLTDLATGGPDARRLPYGTGTVHAIVLDPPYRYVEAKSTAGHVHERYNLDSVRGRGHDAVMDLYRHAMAEAARVLMVGGYLIVKCQDTITDGKQQWVHVELMAHAQELDCEVIDLAVVTPSQVPPTRWKVQRSLRKAHSYFLVCRKGGRWPFGYRAVSKR